MPRFEDLKEKIKPGVTESVVRGGAQSVSLGYADEMAGALGAGREVLMGNVPLSGISDAYTKERDLSREAYREAEEENPTAYTVGEVGGGLATLAIPGAAGVKGAMAMGALSGIGRSDEPLDSPETVGSAVLGAGLGAAVGAGAERFKGVLNKMGVAKADTKFRNAMNKDVEAFKQTGAVSPKLNKFIETTEAGEAALAKKTADQLESEASALGFKSTKDYSRYKYERLMEELRKKSGTEELPTIIGN